MKNVETGDIVKIVQTYNAYIKNVCRRFYLVGGTSEDLYEEGVIGLLEACKSFNGDSLFDKQFEPFAKLCIRRQIFDAIKKTQTQKNKALNDSISLMGINENGEEISKLETLTDRTSMCDPLEIFIDREKFEEKMRACEKELSGFEKQVLSHYLSGEKQSEIAKKLNKSIKSIDNTLQRIKNKFK